MTQKKKKTSVYGCVPKILVNTAYYESHNTCNYSNKIGVIVRFTTIMREKCRVYSLHSIPY
jgi:hypothetical protein